jgi:hypothetical protein
MVAIWSTAVDSSPHLIYSNSLSDPALHSVTSILDRFRYRQEDKKWGKQRTIASEEEITFDDERLTLPHQYQQQLHWTYSRNRVPQ